MGYLDNAGLARFYAGLKGKFATKAAATQAVDGLMSAADKGKLDGIAAGANLAPNRNLLDNWDFRNPVSQRGMTVGQTLPTDWICNIDRWKMPEGTHVLGAGYLIVNGRLTQYIESPPATWAMNGKPCTISVLLLDGTVKSVTVTPQAGNDASATIAGITMGLYNSTTYKEFRIKTTVQTRIVAVKLEAGNTSTLAQDAPANYALELIKCQRYFYRYSGRYFIGKWNDVYNYANFSFPTTMRVAPAISNVVSEQGWGTVGVFSADAQSIAFAASGNVGSCLGFDASAEI